MAIIEQGTHVVSGIQFAPKAFENSDAYALNIKCADKEGNSIYGTLFLLNKQGELIQKNYDFAKELWGWDGADPFWFEDNEESLTEIEFEIVVEEDQYNGKTRNQVKYFNKIGGSGNGIQRGDRRELTSKFGAKFRAMAGSKPKSVAPAPRPAPAPTAPPAPPAPPVATQVATAEGCAEGAWDLFVNLCPTNNPEARTTTWWSLLDHVSGIVGKSSDQFTATEWQIVVNKVREQYDKAQ